MPWYAMPSWRVQQLLDLPFLKARRSGRINPYQCSNQKLVTLCGSAAPQCGKAQPYRKLLNFSSAAPPPSSPESLNRKLLNSLVRLDQCSALVPGEAAEPQEPD